MAVGLTLLAGTCLAANVRSQGRRRAVPQPSSRAATAQPAAGEVKSLARITSRADFDRLSRVYYRGRFYALPHLMFVIDRRDHDRVYYVNSKRFAFHKDFVNATYLSLERGRAFYENNYLKAERRFLLGTIAYQPSLDRFTFEFWEGDRLTGDLLAAAFEALSRTFYAPLTFKANSSLHEAAAAEANKRAAPPMPVMTAQELAGNSDYQPLNLGAGIGQLRILDRLTPDTVIDRNQIVIFKEVPVQLTPLSGIITTEPASPLSHVNMLAKSWGIPVARIKNADKLFKQLEGKYVRLDVNENLEHLCRPPEALTVSVLREVWYSAGCWPWGG